MPIRTNRGRVAVYRRLWGWPMRSPRHLVATALVIIAVVLTVGLIVPRLTGSGTGSAGASASTDPGSAANLSQPGTTPGQTGGAAPGGPTTAPATSSSLPTRLPSQTQTPSSAPPAAKALDVATQWANAWVNHPQGTTNEQWLAALRPLTTEEQLSIMTSVDPANIPATAVTGNPVVKTSYEKSVEVTVPTNGGPLSITVIERPDGWRVAHYDQAA